MLSLIEKKIIAFMQGDLPIVRRPYLDLSKKLKISEKFLIITLDKLAMMGVMRRFGATLRHQKTGYDANVMVAWVVKEDRIEIVGEIMASFKEVSHCYKRTFIEKDWPYNLYTMVHGKNKQTCCEIIKKISERTSSGIYSMLFSIKELKKTSMTYYSDEDL